MIKFDFCVNSDLIYNILSDGYYFKFRTPLYDSINPLFKPKIRPVKDKKDNPGHYETKKEFFYLLSVFE